MIFLIGQVTKAPVMTMLSPLLKCKVWWIDKYKGLTQYLFK